MSLYMLKPPLLLLNLETEPAATMPDPPSLNIPRHRCIHHEHTAWTLSLLLIERRGWSDLSISRAARSPAYICLRANCLTLVYPLFCLVGSSMWSRSWKVSFPSFDRWERMAYGGISFVLNYSRTREGLDVSRSRIVYCWEMDVVQDVIEDIQLQDRNPCFFLIGIAKSLTCE